MSETFESGSSSSSTYVYIWPVLGLFIVVFVGLVGNTLVCLSIKLDPKLKNATNNYLFSLALTDLLVSILVIPFAIIKHFFNNVWIFGKFFCTLWIFLDVFLCTFSILLLCVISCVSKNFNLTFPKFFFKHFIKIKVLTDFNLFL